MSEQAAAPAPGPLSVPASAPGSVHLAARLPALGSIRFRLAGIYSLVLFGLASVALGVLYALVAHDLGSEHVSQTYVVQRPILTQDGLVIERQTVQAELTNLEHLVNQRALEELRKFSFFALGGLLVTSMGVGWFVAGRVLAPIGRITGVARQIQATDLSLRIGMTGPPDELQDLADTFDGMLGRLQSAFESQRRFIQDASHELRNPLAVMRTNLDVTLADPGASADDLRHSAEVASRSAERMSNLVDDLLAFARHGLPDEDWQPVPLASLAAEVADELAVPAARRSLSINVAVDGAATVTADRTLLRQVLVNLVGNAVRLAPEGTAIAIAGGVQGGWAYLSVADEGPGIPEDQQAAVFERFWRAPGQPPDSDGAPHSGLGLTIVRSTVERHGGRVDLVSKPGEGSTFVVWLPAVGS